MSDTRKITMLHYAKKLAEYCEETSCRECPFFDLRAGGQAFCALHDETPVRWLPMIHQLQEGGAAHAED